MDADSGDVSRRERRIGTWLHLSTFFGWVFPLGQLIVPTWIWFASRTGSPFADHHGKQVIRFQLIVTLIAYPLMFLMAVGQGDGGALLALPLFLLAVTELVLLARAALAAHRGKWYRYPIPTF